MKFPSFKLSPKDIAYSGIYLSLILIMGFTPYLGFVPISGISIALILIPIAIISIHYGYKGALVGIITFGFVSFFAGFYIDPSTQFIINTFGAGKWFIQAVVSRLIVAIIVSIIALAIKKLPLYWRMIIIVLSLVILNTLIYLLFLNILFASSIEGYKFAIVFTTVWVNVIVEWSVIPLITMAFYPFLKHFLKEKK